MRDLEFLPDWYPKLGRRKRAVAFQAWITLAIAAFLGLWTLLAQRDVRATEAELRDISSSLTRSVAEVERLKKLEKLKDQYAAQDMVFARIGRPIEMTRLLTTLAEIMPDNMSMLNLQVSTEETKVESLKDKAQQQRGTNRKMKLKLQGVAPTDGDLGSFLNKLTGKPFFTDVALIYSKPRSESGHTMREFEVSFTLDLGGLGVN
jgi:hypothetical protein